jgi:hypothetical protein
MLTADREIVGERGNTAWLCGLRRGSERLDSHLGGKETSNAGRRSRLTEVLEVEAPALSSCIAFHCHFFQRP